MTESENHNTEPELPPSGITVRLARYFRDQIKGVTRASKHKHQRKNYAREFYNKAKEEAWKRPIEAIGLVLLFLYTSFAGYQSCKVGESVTEQADATRAAVLEAAIADEAMRVSNRPYVQINSSDIAQWILDEKGQQAGITVYLENVGNTPAEETMACGVVVNAFPKKVCEHLELRAKFIGIPNEPKGHITYTFSNGPIIPAHRIVPVTIANLDSELINHGLADKTGFVVMGAFEYMNVFDEYCCQPFELHYGRGSFTTEAAAGFDIFCPNDRTNVCRPKSQQRPTEK